MRALLRLVPSFAVLAILAFPAVASAGHTTDPRTPNLVPLGHIVEPAILGGFGGTEPDIQTDIAFWGSQAFQGNWDGFNIRGISSSAAPSPISRTFCDGSQGDVVVWQNVLVRSWDVPTPAAGRTCDGQAVAPNFEGLHVFDITNRADPRLVAQVLTPCGSHTATGVPDPANNRLLVYNSASSAACPQIDVVQVPLAAPQTASVLRSVPAGGACHDTGVILGRSLLAGCAGGTGFALFSLGGARGGSLDSPAFLYRVAVPTVTIGHSAAFSWNGEILLFGHEPGGGVAAECEATDDPLKKTLFFYRTSDGALLGTWTLPRLQTALENCTVHNYNVVPFADRHVLVHGSYQSGTSVVDFTTPSAAREVAWSDPPPRPLPPGTTFCCDVGGAWSSYWYNDLIYETNINEGLNVFDVNEPWWERAISLPHLNPQTQEVALSCRVRVRGRALRARQRTSLVIPVRILGQGIEGLRVRLRGAGVSRTTMTHEGGDAHVTVRPARRGTLRISVPNTLNMTGCATTRAVRAARAVRPPALTGRFG